MNAALSKPLRLALGLSLLLLLPFKGAGGEAKAASSCEGLRVDGSWTLCSSLTLGLNTELKDVKARALEGFEVELFHSGGVRTSLRESLPEPFLKALDSVKTPPEKLPEGSSVQEGDYALYKRVAFNSDYGDICGFLGTPCAARPVFDIHSGRPISEYYWDAPSGGLLFVRLNGNCVLEKALKLKEK